MKILILKPSSLGDVVQALPVLRLLKLADPTHEIYWWISTDLRPLLENDPDLTGLFPFERRRWAKPQHWNELLASIRRMRALKFDLVIDLQGLARSASISWLARGALTVGLDDPREGGRAFYDVAIPRPSFTTHAVDWYLAVLSRLGVPVHDDFTWMPLRPETAANLRKKWPVESGSWITINPGARWPNKRWPLEFYCELVERLLAHNEQVRVAIIGSNEDASLGAAIARADLSRCLDLTAKTSLGELTEWIRISDLIVCNDTGPMHIAAALGRPVISIFGPTEPRRTGPYGQIDRVLRVELPCAPCLKSFCVNPNKLECLRAITPGLVFDHIRERWRGNATETSRVRETLVTL